MARGQEQVLISTHEAPLRFGLPALVLGNLCLAFGPLFVRMADTGPIAAAFWRIAIAVPFLFMIARAMGDPARRIGGRYWLCSCFRACSLPPILQRDSSAVTSLHER